MITFSCLSCHKKLSVREDALGKKAKCPACGQLMKIPAPAAVAESESPVTCPDLSAIPRGPSETSDAPTSPPSAGPDATVGLQPLDSDHPDNLTNFLAPAEAPDELGRLGKYRILKILGHGGMGVVYQAEDSKLKRMVAIKAMLPGLAGSANAAKRFMREAEAMAAVEHDHIVRIYDTVEDRGVAFMAMEFLRGESLDERLKREERLPVDDVLRIGREIAEGLAAAHATGLIHRDIKPGNIWLEDRSVGHAASTGLFRANKVGSYPPNRLGLYDMHGNVTQWCNDILGMERPIRGGSWNRDAAECRATTMFTAQPSLRFADLGLRLARVAVTPVVQPQRPIFHLGNIYLVGKEGLEFDTSLTVKDTRDSLRPGFYTKVFQVKLFKGNAYVIDMISSQIDSFLRLEDSKGKLLAQDDDSGGGQNARMHWQPSADGDYRIVATVFGPPITNNVVGPFKLRIREEPFVANQSWPHYVLTFRSKWNLSFHANSWITGFSSDGKLFLAAGDANSAGNIPIWDAATGNLVQQLVPRDGVWYSNGQFVPGSKYVVASYSREKDLYLWDAVTGNIVRKFVGHTTIAPDVAVSPTGKHLLSWADDMTVRLWDVDTGKELAKLEGHTNKAKGAFSPDGKHIVTWSPDMTVRRLDVATGKEPTGNQLKKLTLNVGKAGPVACFSPDSKQLLSYSPDSNLLQAWDIATNKEIWSFVAVGKVQFAQFLANSRLVVVHHGRFFRILDGATGRHLYSINRNQFGAVGHEDTWTVNGVEGGNLAVGGISDTGLYLAPQVPPSPATVTITATEAYSSMSLSAQLTITPPPISVSINPVSLNMPVNGTMQFAAQVATTSALPISTAVTWGVKSPGAPGQAVYGTISSTGLYTAPAKPPVANPIPIYVTSQEDPTKSAVAYVSVTTGPVVTLSPVSAALGPGATMQFSASGTGVSNTNVTWSVNGTAGGSAAVGTITSSGLYTAPPGSSALLVSVQATLLANANSSVTASVAIIPPGTVSTMQNPQVALYSFNVPKASQVSIEFGPDTNYGLNTWTKSTPSSGGQVQILVAGMLGFTSYHMRAVAQFTDGTQFTDSDHVFTTAGPPASKIPSMTATTTPGMTPNSGIELLNLLYISEFGSVGDAENVAAIDLSGNLIWSYDNGNPALIPNPVKLLPDGNMLINYTSSAVDGTNSLLEEIDLAGNLIWQMSAADLNAALAAAGFNITIVGTHHDVAVLPNGHLILIASENQNFVDLPGYPGTTTVMGDVLIDLDSTRTPVWIWSEFDHLDVNRHPMSFPDWTHTNAVLYLPSDGNLVISVRHQHWVIKVDYNNGLGTGAIVWKLGWQGDFTLEGGTDPIDWFYAQHAPSFVSKNTSGTFDMTLFDNGDNRPINGTPCGDAPTSPCYSRVPLFEINESAMTATILWQDTLSSFSFFGGNAEVLPNGNSEFDECASGGALPAASVYEVTQDPIKPQTVWQLQIAGQYAYRAMRIPSLYPGVQW